MENFFKLKQYGTNVRTEVIAGITTFFTMAYIIFVNPQILSITGMNFQGVFVATIIASVVGTLVMALFANVPYALAPGMGLNAFFTFTVCGVMKFTWNQALAMVLICGLINIVITVTGLRKAIIRSLPKVLQSAIGGGIGLFIAYIGVKDAGLLKFTSDPGTYQFFGKTPADATVVANASAVPALVNFSNPAVLLALIGVAIIVVLMVLKVKGSILIGIISTTLIGLIEIACGVNPHAFYPSLASNVNSIGALFGTMSITWSSIGSSISAVHLTAFKMDFPGLFSDPTKIVLAFTAIIAFILTDIFDALGTFIGTGRRTGIFDENDEKLLLSGKGVKSRMDRALFADLCATITGAFVGTSNTTTYVESSAGIAEGGRTGLTSVVTAILFALCLILAPVVGIVPAAATAPALIVVGMLMIASIADIDWHNFEDAAVAFITVALMPFAYSITTGIAFGFIVYVLIKIIRGKAKEVHPIMYGATALFIVNFIMLAIKNL
ncbi:MAG: NCS2 family permease [Clostridia bacterium]|nr:NCS2 family permease [Clostridia bacterium]MDR3643523.1 NCS2 family permease [Clostridia bacterium]